ncbi:MAG: ImuA family protein [Alkalilacustris sp.]
MRKVRLCPEDAEADTPELTLGRVHELCGPARRTLALWLAQRCKGPVVWIAAAHAPERLHAPGVAAAGLDPARLTFVDCPTADDLLWTAEEALRHLAAVRGSGAVVADIAAPPRLTPVRRLHLAAGGAEAGQTQVPDRPPGLPLGLLLTPENGGAQGVESRWHLRPNHGADRSCWDLERRRARGAGPTAWQVERTGPGYPATLRLRRLGAPHRP